jgi:hypothetical protein
MIYVLKIIWDYRVPLLELIVRNIARYPQSATSTLIRYPPAVYYLAPPSLRRPRDLRSVRAAPAPPSPIHIVNHGPSKVARSHYILQFYKLYVNFFSIFHSPSEPLTIFPPIWDCILYLRSGKIHIRGTHFFFPISDCIFYLRSGKVPIHDSIWSTHPPMFSFISLE